jgi:hypothetical protein
MWDLEFANPAYLHLLWSIPLLIAWEIWRERDKKAIVLFPSFAELPKQKSVSVWTRHIPLIFRLLAIAFLIVALARPQSFSKEQTSTTEGIDIMLSLDVSSSMLARDFEPDRIEAAKRIGIQFISGRPSDRMGLVIFASEAFTMCPLTLDHAALINQFNAVSMDMLEDGTAIGSGLAMAVNRLLNSDAVSRVVILLTDGVNNSGEIAPYTAAEIAQTYGIRVYVVGIGSMGTAPYPVQTPFGIRYQQVEVQIDEKLMKEVAQLTGGEYFRATDNKTLEEIYQKIDSLEKSKINVDEFLHRSEEFLLWGILSFFFVVLEILYRAFILRRLP